MLVAVLVTAVLALQSSTVPPSSQEKPVPPAVERANNGVISPRLVKDSKPNYTSAAKKAGISGTVHLEAVVLPNGKVGDVRVTRSLDREHGLDEEAVKTVKKWKFKPGTKDGVPVPVIVAVEMSFTLRK